MEQPADTEIPLAVKSLRSLFEQRALENSSYSNQGRNGSQGDLLMPTSPLSPRPRASSGTYSNSNPESRHLRTSSSSSDVNAGTKRPPPPPPPARGSKGPSPSPTPSPAPSPLLRPVPIPPWSPSGSPISPRLGHLSLPAATVLDSLDSGHVASMRNKFASTPPAALKSHTPRQSISSIYPPIQIESTTNPLNKPAVPPRPPKSTEIRTTSFLHVPQSRSPDEVSHQPAFTLLSSPGILFSEDEDTELRPEPAASAPPALPTRRLHAHSHHHQASSGSLDVHTDDSSLTSSESDFGQESTPPPKSFRPAIIPPPRPPPRSRISVLPPTVEPSSHSASSSSSSSGSALAPPPLPTRRSLAAQFEEIAVGLPLLPARPQLAIPAYTGPPEPPASSSNERKSLGSSRLPPPPTRTIALGDKLPPPRRPPTPSSDEDSADEEDAKSQGLDSLPDSSRSSRRPPVLSFREGYSEPKIHVHAFSGHASIAGTTVVVAHNHHIKIYDLAVSDIPVNTVDTKEMGSKDVKVTSMELRPSAKKADRGFLLWLGTKDGHIFEIDTRTGSVTGSKNSAHLHPVTHMFRHGRMMVTFDDSGKVLIFAPEDDGEDISLATTQPRAVRIAEKQDFVKILGGKLWTAARAEQHGVGTPAKTPVIRVYDLFAPGNVGRSLLPTDHVGPVTSATIIPSQPGHVYMGHEEGFVTVWVLDADEGYPRCIEVMKVSTSDVLSLEGVNDRLWAGGRSGMISAYDVTHRPWLVTNCWNAHPGLPVLKLMVDHYGIGKTGRLCVVSVGRDEQLRLWDGLLGLDWVDEELLKRETSFSKFRDLNILLVSWNCDSAKPDSLSGDPENISFLTDVLHSVDSPDIVCFGFQEVIDLESRKMAAKNVLLGSKKKPEDGGLSDKVTGAYKRWYDRLVLAMWQAMPKGMPYAVVHTESLVGLFTCIFVKHSERMSLRDVAITTIKRGMGGRYGNKGGIVARFVIEDSSICLINCHLAAGQNAVRQRNADVAGMLEEKAVFPETEYPLAYVGGGDASMVLDHEIVFVNGDMNYRIDHRRDAIIAAIRASDTTSLLGHDQLLREIKFNRACRFRGFSEGPLTFLPTYKYDRRSSEYDSSEKRRSPAWCDRVLWRSRIPARVHQLHYQRYEANVSDHRPISAAFTVTVKSVKHDVREKVKSEVQLTWIDEQARLLSAAIDFYVRQALV